MEFTGINQGADGTEFCLEVLEKHLFSGLSQPLGNAVDLASWSFLIFRDSLKWQRFPMSKHGHLS